MRLKSLLLLAAGLAVLTGCEVLEPKQEVEAQPSAPPEPVVQILPEPGLTPRERMRKSLTLLEVGRAERARVELAAYLAEVPDSRLAKDLLTQIDADPVAVLGEEHFLYVMGPGESISSVSKKMLGDPLKFHLLARYNGLENPSEIKAGQVIRVPGKRRLVREAVRPPKKTPAPSKPKDKVEAALAATLEPAEPENQSQTAPKPKTAAAETAKKIEPQAAEPEPSPAAPAPSPAVPAQVAKAPNADEAAETSTIADPEAEIRAQTIKLALLKVKSYSDKSDFGSAINHVEEGLLEYPDATELQISAVQVYSMHAESLIQSGDLTAAERSLRRAAEFSPDDPTVGTQLAALERRRRIESLYLEASRLQNQHLPIKAYDVYSQVIGLEPGHAAAKRELTNLRPVVAEAYHRQAITAYRQQNLEKAVNIWDKVLKDIDPEYNPAKVYRAQAIDLMQKLKSLSDDQSPKEASQ